MDTNTASKAFERGNVPALSTAHGSRHPLIRSAEAENVSARYAGVTSLALFLVAASLLLLAKQLAPCTPLVLGTWHLVDKPAECNLPQGSGMKYETFGTDRSTIADIMNMLQDGVNTSNHNTTFTAVLKT